MSLAMTFGMEEFDGFCSNEIDETDGRCQEFSKGQGDREATALCQMRVLGAVGV